MMLTAKILKEFQEELYYSVTMSWDAMLKNPDCWDPVTMPRIRICPPW